MKTLLHSKKGIIAFILFGIAFIMSITIFMINVKLNDLSTSTDFIGKLQMYTFGTFQSSFSLTSYFKIAAEYSLAQTIYEKSYLGYRDDLSSCEFYGGFPVWDFNTPLCSPSYVLEDSIRKSFLEYLKVYLMNFPDYIIPVSSIVINDLLFDDNLTISGGFSKGVSLPIDLERSEQHVISLDPSEYYADPFLVEVDGLLWPLSPRKSENFIVTSLMGFRDIEETDSLYHNGVDIASTFGEPIYAIADGKVDFVDSYDDPNSFGQIRIINNDDLVVKILHASKIFVKKGDKVKKGDVIGLVGGYGNGNPNRFVPHLHLEFLRNNIPVDPLVYYINELNFTFSSDPDLIAQATDVRNTYLYESQIV